MRATPSFRNLQDLDFEAPFEMVVTKPGTVSGLVISFDTGFFAKSDPPPPPPPAPAGPHIAAAAAVAEKFTKLEAAAAKGDKQEGAGGGVREPQTAAPAPAAPTTVASWFSTGPESRPTHWKQTLLWLRPSEKPEGLAKGDAIVGRLSLHRNEVNPRELGLTVTWAATQQSTGRTFGGTQKYTVT